MDGKCVARMGWLAAVLVTGACASLKDDAAEGSGTGFMDDDVPGGNRCTDGQCPDTDGETDTESSGTTGESELDQCGPTDPCPPGTRCTAPFDPEAGRRMPFRCTADCIPDMDESAWCSDAAACCSDDAICTPRGYCTTAPAGDTTGSATTSGDTTGGASDGTAGDTSGSTGTTG